MREDIVFKGYKDGVQLIINNTAEFTAVMEQLGKKLAAAADFFTAGTVIHLSPAVVQAMTETERQQFTELLADYGIGWEAVASEELAPNVRDEGKKPVTEPLIVTKTLRGGQTVSHPGTVVVEADVNPGAMVVAGGDIIVHGACRGIVHAGAFGNSEATITANRLLATQIRIAGLITRAPDDFDKPDCVETARIKDGVVIIEPADRQEV